MPCRRPPAIVLIESFRSALGELKALRVNCHKEIAGTSRNHLASKTIALSSHQRRPFALVAHVTAVAPADEYGFCFAHIYRVGARCRLTIAQAQRTEAGGPAT